MGHPITPFSIFKDTRLLLRHVHFRYENSPLKNHFPLNEFDYDVFDGDRVVGHLYFQDGLVGARWFWSITGSALGYDHRASGSAETLFEAKIALAAAWEQTQEPYDSSAHETRK